MLKDVARHGAREALRTYEWLTRTDGGEREGNVRRVRPVPARLRAGKSLRGGQGGSLVPALAR